MRNNSSRRKIRYINPLQQCDSFNERYKSRLFTGPHQPRVMDHPYDKFIEDIDEGNNDKDTPHVGDLGRYLPRNIKLDTIIRQRYVGMYSNDIDFMNI